MERYRWGIVLVLATVFAAGVETAAVHGGDDAPLTTEEKAELAAKRKEEWHNKQMLGLWVCVAAVCFVSLLFWVLSNYNKARKQQVERERRETPPPDDIAIPSYLCPPKTAPLEPPPGDW